MLRHANDAGIPDARWINRELNITDVARELECRLGAHNKIHCWHPEKHQNGDRTASVGIHTPTNRVKCFGCNSGLMSVLDLVIDVLGITVTEAIRWLDARFAIPRIPKGRQLKEPERARFQVGQESPMELLVRSGVWARLSPSAQRILPALLNFAETDEKRRYRVKMSYRGVMRYSGVRSHNAVNAALKELREWYLLDSMPVSGPSAPIRPASEYLVTPHSDEFQEIANAVAGEHRAAIAIERELRKQARAERLKRIQTQTPGEHSST